MSTHYLIDAFGSPMLSSVPLDVVNPPNGQSLVNGTYVVKVPDGVSVVRPSDLTDLLTQKYAGLLALYAGFSHITFDSMLDSTHIDSSSSIKVLLGQRSSIALEQSGLLQSTAVALSGSAPHTAIVVWETFQYTDADDKSDRFQRTYVEADPGTLSCVVSFNGGSSFVSAVSGGIIDIGVPDRGTSFIMLLQNGFGPFHPKTYVGSWAVIY